MSINDEIRVEAARESKRIVSALFLETKKSGWIVIDDADVERHSHSILMTRSMLEKFVMDILCSVLLPEEPNEEATQEQKHSTER